MCGPKQPFFFQCGPETPKVWTPLKESPNWFPCLKVYFKPTFLIALNKMSI